MPDGVCGAYSTCWVYKDSNIYVPAFLYPRDQAMYGEYMYVCHICRPLRPRLLSEKSKYNLTKGCITLLSVRCWHLHRFVGLGHCFSELSYLQFLRHIVCRVGTWKRLRGILRSSGDTVHTQSCMWVYNNMCWHLYWLESHIQFLSCLAIT